MKIKLVILVIVLIFSIQIPVEANLIIATPSNYTSFLSGLLPGDTLYLTPGNYLNQLDLNNLNGTADLPIVIMGAGNTTVFLGNACCNTVDMTNCSYLVIRDFEINGLDINYIDRK
jgi:hypothetical protein